MRSYPFSRLEQRFALAVCLRSPQQSAQSKQLQQDELRSLIQSSGSKICAELQFTLKKHHPGHLLGLGQIEEIAVQVALAEQRLEEQYDIAEALDFIVLDGELSPTQLFNLEKIWKKQVIERKALILTLFEQRAQSREAHLQVALARLYYEKPRLKRAWTHLSRQRGGRYGTRGEGEKQIEVDARLIDKKIRELEGRLAAVQKRRKQQRKQGAQLPHIALAGYTNAGKSALMCALSQRESYVADRLFATLDPKSGKLSLPQGTEAILTDTVGFVRNLPHELIDAFRATLEETVLADLQLLVLDASDAKWPEKLATVHNVLEELEVDQKAQLLVLNKIDRLQAQQIGELQALFPEAICISAKTGQGLEALCKRMSERLSEIIGESRRLYGLKLLHEEGAQRAWLFAQHAVHKEMAIDCEGQGFHIRLSGRERQRLIAKFPKLSGRLEPF